MKRLYQTVANRENADEVESHGPYKCTRTPWLGEGYYFWETFIDYAHWWGHVGYNDTYFVCQTTLLHPDEIFDLAGDTDVILEFQDYANILKTKYKHEITISFVIEHMKRNASFPYKAIRARHENEIKWESINAQTMKFVPNRKEYMTFRPPFQICVIDKSILSTEFSVIYPQEYCKECFV